MKLSELYNRAVRFGCANDPRKHATVFEDSAILYGDPNTQVKKALVGIDMESPELLLADRIRAREGLDLVIAHHPEGQAYAALYKIIQMQAEILRKIGVSHDLADALIQERQRQVHRSLLPNNHTRAVDTARLLNMPFVCLHTPADNHVFAFLNQLMQRKKPRTIQDILDILMTIPEYRIAKDNNAGPCSIIGSPKRTVGKILVEMTGGTEGHKDIYDKLYKAGVRTLICMHLSAEHFKNAKNAHLNVIIAGHISSDTLGLNLLLDNIQKNEKLQVISCSGFNRIERNSQKEVQ
jgi:putative NIF3 family GTP cyclohydrolase 1 type 2